MKKQISFILFLLPFIFFTAICGNAFGTVLPRFMMIIDENNSGNGNTGDTERIISQTLIEQGAEVIDPQLVKASIDNNQAIQALSGNSGAAASIGLQFGADIMLVGKATVLPSNGIKNTGMKSYQATINIKAIKTDTAQVIYNGNGTAAKLHVNDITGGSLALQSAARQIAGNLLTQVSEKQKAKGKAGAISRVQLIVGNVNEFWQVAEVKKLLRDKISGVEDVVQRSYVTGSAIFDIHYAGTIDSLAETIAATRNQEVHLKIQGLSQNKIDTIYEIGKTTVAISQSTNSNQRPAKVAAKAVPVAQPETSPAAAPVTSNKTINTASVSPTASKRQHTDTAQKATVEQTSSPQAPEPLKNKIQFGNYHALLIGNSKYKSIESLNTPISDVKAVAQTLSEKYGFKTQFLFDATRYEMLSKLNELRGTLNRQDNLLIYYAGHGWLDDSTNEGYWLPVDSEKDNSANWLSNSTITNILKSMEAKHVMIVSDSCYSGTLTRSIKVKLRKPSYIQKMAQKRARTVLASGGLEPVLDSGGDKNHSIFATAFINALKENNASYIETTHLFAKIRRAVVVNSDQTPEYSDVRKAGHNGGEFIFKRSN